MSLKGAGYIVGAWEHPTRKATDKSVTLLHAECAKGALDDAGLTKDDVDAYYCAGDAPGLGPMSMIDYMGLKVRHMDSTDVGGSTYQVAVGHALQAIATGRANVAHDYDLAIVVQFDSVEDYRAFLEHPVHQQLVREWRSKWRRSYIVDFAP